jgi:hypothetical protein
MGPDPCFPADAGTTVDSDEMIASDDDQERMARLLLLGKGAVLAHRLAPRLAAELDDEQQRRWRLLLRDEASSLRRFADGGAQCLSRARSASARTRRDAR